MEKKLFFLYGMMLLALVIVTSCDKPIQELDQSDEVFLKSGSKQNAEMKYRLVVDSGLSDGFLLTYHYNDKGLADKLQTSKPNSNNNYWATMEYNQKDQISKARFYWSEEEFYDIIFLYKNNQLIEETWYNPTNSKVYDQYKNKYNKKGQLVKRDNPPYQIYSIFHYDNYNNCKLIEIFDYNENLIWAEEFEFTRRIKNPFTTVKGLPISIFWVNDIKNPDRFNGYKVYILENGNQVVFFHWQSAETEIITGKGNYPIYQNSYDVVSDTWTDQVWKYENYAGKRESEDNLQKIASLARKSGINAPRQLKFKGETFRQEIKEMRMKHENAERAVTK